MIKKTVKFIKEAHQGQEDKQGVPFYKHPIEVARKLPEKAPEHVKVAALLHDVLEDTHYTKQNLLDMGFDVRSVEIVDILTRKDETYGEMIDRICNSGNFWTIVIKLADNTHNIQDDRSSNMPEGLLKRYRKARKKLLEALPHEYRSYFPP